jgi:branched-chain amino acid transport system ATP-binding protein
MSAPLLHVSDLAVSYGRVEAVRGVALQVMPGEFVTVIGANGAGKSSTMKAIAGVVAPVAGRVTFEGQDRAGWPSHRMAASGLAMVPEGRQVFADQTVHDNLLLGAHLHSGDPAGVETRIEEAFGLFPRLKERRDQLAGSLSGGEQQMLAIARGLQTRPKLLIIDELSLGLAPKILDMLFPVLLDLNARGLSILLVEQMANLALSVAHRAYVMENGRVIADGEAKALAKDPRVMAAYLGKH